MLVTVSVAAGRSEAWVVDRTGERASVTISCYRRATTPTVGARVHKRALDGAIPGLQLT